MLMRKSRYRMSPPDEHGLEFLEGQVARTKDEDAQLELLSRMALVAQTNLGSPSRAAELWERCVALRPDTAQYHESLASLYDSMADLEGVARALDRAVHQRLGEPGLQGRDLGNQRIVDGLLHAGGALRVPLLGKSSGLAST